MNLSGSRQPGPRPLGALESCEKGTHHDVDLLVQVFAGGAERLGRAERAVPDLVPDARVEFFWVLFAHHVETMRDGRVLQHKPWSLNRRSYEHCTQKSLTGHRFPPPSCHESHHLNSHRRTNCAKLTTPMEK